MTIDSMLESTLHDRQRRVERQIDKITLQEARRYGMSEKQSKGRIKYTYAGHVFIFDTRTNNAVTSWKIDLNRPYGAANGGNGRKTKKKKEPKSGTRYFKPLLIQASTQHDTAELSLFHDEVRSLVHDQKEKWTSHTVLVVDMSGSMRDDDVDGARCRADGVWTTLARDFIKKQLEDETCSVYDVVSVIVMRKTALVVIDCEPVTYVLYNKLVKFRDWDTLKPHGHGFYKPALQKAQELLDLNANGSCSLSLLFFSDGKPSDHVQDNQPFNWHEYNQVNKELVQMLGMIGARFGRRLNIMCVGMAGQDERFDTLESMVEEARMYGTQAAFNRPNLNTESLSAIVSSSVASSLASKTEMTSLKTGKTRSVRTDVERERLNAPDDTRVNADWRVFRSTSEDEYVQNIWKWNSRRGDFAKIIDPRCNICYKDVADYSDYSVAPGKGMPCRECRACFFCERCLVVGGYQTHRNSGECLDYAKQRRSGFLVTRSNCLMSYNVAWKKKAFGEGAERLAFKFRFLGKQDTFVGPVMVAKESRFVEDLHDSGTDYLRSHRHAYHKSFMRTQAVASRFAKMFNEATDQLVEIPPRTAPKIEFVKPAIFELEDRTKAQLYNILVEPLIQGKYTKFSNNYGATTSIKRDFASDNEGVDLATAAALLGRNYKASGVPANNKAANTDMIGGLNVIAEGSEDESEDESDEESQVEATIEDNESLDEDFVDISMIRDEDYLQAFSHFTYVRSGGNLLVVDLQGALQMTGKDVDRKTFLLTDPAIHHRRERSDKSRQYGRTDLGRKGMRAFFESHKCNGICRLFHFREKKMQEELDRLSRDRAMPTTLQASLPNKGSLRNHPDQSYPSSSFQRFFVN